MTTIAYRDGVMVADTGCWDGDTYVGEVVKAIRTSAGALVGVSGSAADAGRVFAWAEGGADGPLEIKNGTEALLVSPEGAISFIETEGRPVPIKTEFAATGSGTTIAIGAMAAGASAERAVEIAAQRDAHTRGPFTVLRLAR
ncbi:hypothetical protein [Albimonas pacifica]|uniref:Uncharacterized protein n=1 Tax=Albimonas pacifica TaxID=1114924 RepID=A0A1I3LI45_9RHOB|nr:hypothetical protein [Albimonas pacifica]SFI84433.1 hypothetical protein SAMN05216258_11041 [Albimonas pacifica]